MTSDQQRPRVNNGNYFGVQIVVVVHRFYRKKSLFMLNKIHNNFLVINAAPLEWFSMIQSWTRQHLPATQQGPGAI